MPHKINNKCKKAGECKKVCPVDAIAEGDPIYVINPDMCTECVGFYSEPQCVKVCPVDAILQDPAHQ